MDWVDILQPFLLPVVVGAVGYASFEVRRHFETRRRRLRLLVALRAELSLACDQQKAQFASAGTDEARKKLLSYVETAAEGEHSMPSGAVTRGNPIFDNLKAELSDLPEEIIAPVIAYYETANGVAETLAAFYEGRFETLRVERKKSAIEQFFIAGKYAADTADIAFTVVDGYLREKGYPMRLPKPDSETRRKIEESSQSDATSALSKAASDDDDGRTKTHD